MYKEKNAVRRRSPRLHCVYMEFMKVSYKSQISLPLRCTLLIFIKDDQDGVSISFFFFFRSVSFRFVFNIPPATMGPRAPGHGVDALLNT